MHATRKARGALCALLFGWGAATTAAAQAPDAFVLPAGTFRLSGGGEYASHDELYTSEGAERLGSALSRPLPASLFPPLRPLESSLETFFAGTAGSPGATPFVVTPESVTLGTPEVRVFLSGTHVPLRLEVGVAPRVQIGVMVPLVQGRQLVQRLTLEGATVGANPDPAGNAELLGQLGANGEELGGGPLLPTRESAAGQELQRRVQAATDGESLALPRGDSVSGSVLQRLIAGEAGVDSLRSAAGEWSPGDVEIEARVLVLDRLDGEALPRGHRGIGIRAAVAGAIRLATGEQPDSIGLFPRDPDVGLSGYRVGAVADAFIGSRWWVTAGVRQVVLGASEVTRRVAPPDAPLSVLRPERVEWNPADTLELRVAPNYRLAEPISIGAEYRAGWLTESTYEGAAGVLDTPGGLTQRVGVGIRYNTLPAYARGATDVPLDIGVSYLRTVGGPAGSRVESGVQLYGRLYAPLWGRGLRR